jgi:hypothetical protein
MRATVPVWLQLRGRCLGLTAERRRQLDPLSLIIATDYGAILYFDASMTVP